MIRPVLTDLREELLPGLEALFAACNMLGWSPSAFNRQLSVVALHEEKVVGFVTAWDCGQPYAWVDCLLVAPEYRRVGIGAHLCFAIEAILLRRGVRCIRAVVESDVVAVQLERAGFHREGPFHILEMFYEGT